MKFYEAAANYGTGSVSDRTHLTCCFTTAPPNDLQQNVLLTSQLMRLTLQAITILSLVLVAHMQGLTNLSCGQSSGEYPSKPVHIVEPFGSGGGPDLLARALAPKLGKLWNQSVTVDNMPGAGATAGPAHVAKAPADGFTLLMNTSAHAYSAAALKDLSYQPLRDFTPVIALTRQAYVLVTGKSTGVRTVRELIAVARAKGSAIKFGSTGIGTGTHIGVERFNQAVGLKVRHVPPLPTASVADALAKVIAGQVDYCMLPISLASPAIRDGRLIALGVTTKRRSILLPGIPTIAEAGVAGFDFPIWYGIWVRAGTPARVIAQLEQDLRKALADRDLLDWIAQHGGEPMNMTRSQFAKFVLDESKTAAKILKAAGISPQTPSQ
jgi:tripartite-type tricarboxylate transporter receptor subunit TctC